ncbi:hypothetical protein P3C29_29700 [Pseudomonas sp. 1912-s]|uniref:hypothetical protein n=1 Tax=Pseudomonas sp. 1912-s TaxID=3033802 RepID=UPI0023DFB133|nr:hypothetical protein [Pseudomonas sp. 1912-s]MDF3202871.1 hypothetical protein [Pseudomonas sp. 1912-s]
MSLCPGKNQENSGNLQGDSRGKIKWVTLNFVAFALDEAMRKGMGKIIVLNRNLSSLFGYAEVLNEMGYYSLSLCTNINEVFDLLKAGENFEYLVYDAFDLSKDANYLEMIAGFCAIFSIVTVSDVNSTQRQSVILWARSYAIPLRGVLQAPLRSAELYELIEGSGPY